MNKPLSTALLLSLATLAACETQPDSFELNGDQVLSEAEFDGELELDGELPTPTEPLPGASELLSEPGTEHTMSAPANLALGKSATQSSTAHGGLASYANDGNTDGFFWNNSVSHTAGGPSWWQVDLATAQPVGEVVVHNRSDCCKQLLHDFDLEVSLDGITWESFHQAGIAAAQTPILVDRMARYVRVSNPEVLHMAEVEVFRTRNLAFGKPATQSSTAFGGDASRAVDGNTDGDYGHGSVSHTADQQPSEWWQVDLEAIENIGQIVLFNRTDCCADKLHDFVVSVSNDGLNWTSSTYEGAAPQRHVVVQINREARYVRVQNGSGYLHLAEVQVFEGLRVPGLSYGRGVGTIPAYSCGVGEIMDLGLCYPACNSGYTGVLSECWEDCPLGTIDMGLFCSNLQLKSSYHRGFGQWPESTCSSGHENNGGLCYPLCAPGYNGVGPVCWLEDITIDDVSDDVCRSFRVPVLADFARAANGALTTAVGLGASIGIEGAVELGIAYGETGQYGCFVSTCFGTQGGVELRAYTALGEYDEFGDIGGSSTLTPTGQSGGLNIGNTPLTLGVSGDLAEVHDEGGDLIGMVLDASATLGIDTPAATGQLECETTMHLLD